MMNDRWNKAGALFERIIECEPELRGRLLDEQCRDDPILREMVESLLQADGEADTDAFLEPPGAATAAGLLSEYADTAVHGDQIGRYRLVERIASGGMGSVFRAVVVDHPEAAPVAVKLIRRGMDTPEAVRRFHREREALARLHHPGIARLLDGGVTEHGQPYLVMDHIRGLPIDRYCDTHRMSVADRLRLMIPVCAAIEYAHRTLVVHRDIKPSNVLVTEAGAPVVLDFGIAKLLSADDEPLTVTATELRAITPQYASPEVIRGEPVSTAMDVYSLGVLLYELLTGRPPFDVRHRSAFEIQARICENDPPPPSVAVLKEGGDGGGSRDSGATARARNTSARELCRSLGGDVDTILLKALHRDPSRRYRSVEQLSDDLERHLSGFPINARKDSFRYRAAKFVRRNRATVVAAGLAGASLAVGLGGMAYGLIRAREEADRARMEASRASQINSVLEDILGSIDFEYAGADVTLRRVLDLAAERIEPKTQDRPDVSAAARQAIGNSYASLGLYDEAERHLRTALSVRRAVFGDADPLVAESAASLGRVLRIRGAYDEAEALLREALAIDQERFGELHPNTARHRQSLATLHVDSGDLRAAEKEYRRALKIFHSLPSTADKDKAVAMQELGVVLTFLGQKDEGLGLCREALAIQERHFGRDSVQAASSLRELATALQIAGDFDAAEAAYREALANYRRLRGDVHPIVSRILNNMGVMLGHTGRREEGAAMLREALALRRKTLGDKHIAVSVTLNNLATLVDDRAAAEPLLRESLSIAREAFGDSDHRTADAMQNLAVTLVAQEKLEDAEPLYREALEAYRRALGEKHIKVSFPLYGLGKVLLTRGDAAAAEPLLRESVALRRAAEPTPSENLATALSAWGAALTELERFEQAESALHEALERLEPLTGWKAEDDATATLRRLIRLYDRTDRPERAAEYRARLEDRT